MTKTKPKLDGNEKSLLKKLNNVRAGLMEMVALHRQAETEFFERIADKYGFETYGLGADFGTGEIRGTKKEQKSLPTYKKE